MKKTLLALLVVGSIFIYGSASASAQSQTATWEDATTIKYEGLNFYDANPYDTTYRASTSDGCSVEGGGGGTIYYNSDRTKITSSQGPISAEVDGECESFSIGGGGTDAPEFIQEEFGGVNEVTFNAPQQGFVAGYKTDATTIGIYKAGSGAARPELATFKSLPEDPNKYYLVTGEGSTDSGTYLIIGSGGTIERFTQSNPINSGFGEAPARFSTGQWKLANNGNVTTPPSGVVVADGSGTEAKTCESEGAGLSWILCPVIFAIDQVVEWLDNTIISLLTVQTDYYDNESMRDVWARLRNIAYIILIPVMLVMVIGTALGFNLIDAYTVKKALPRLVIAVLFMSISWPITSFMITFINDVGSGMLGLMTSAVSGADEITLASILAPDADDTAGTAVVLGAGAYFGVGALIAANSIGIILSYALITAIILFTAFLILAFRQFLVVTLALFAPLAILAWIFPGNDKLWKLWWSSFSKLLLMFPIIMILIGSGRIFASIIQQTDADGPIETFLTLTAYLLPYVFIPATFKLAGGVFATVAGAVNNKERSIFDRSRKKRAETRAELKDRAGSSRRFDPNGRLGRFNNMASWGADPISNARIKAGTKSGRAMLSQIGMEKMDHSEKLSGAMSKAGMNDKALRELTDWDGSEKSLNEKANRLASSEDRNERLAANQLRKNAGFLLQSYRNEEYGKGSVKAAAGLALASQGFIKPEEISTIANQLDSDKSTAGLGMGNIFKTNAELLGGRGGALTKPGDTTTVDIDPLGNATYRAADMGMKVGQIQKLGPQDLGSAKGGQIDAQFGDAYESILSANKETRMVTDSDGNITRKEVISVGGKDYDAELQDSVRSTLMQTYSSYSNPDIKTRMKGLLMRGAEASSDPDAVAKLEAELSRYRAPNLDEVARDTARREPPAPGEAL